MVSTRRRALWIALFLPLTAGCLESEIRHDIYLEPDGAAVWSVLQTDVVSNEKDPAKRDREEREFRKRLLGENPPIAEALRILGGWKVETVVLRDERPFALAVKARFPRVDRMLEEYFDRVHPEAGVDADLDREGARTTLTIEISPVEEEGAEADAAVAALEVGDDNLRIHLTTGRFVAAKGFVIEAEGRRAVPILGGGGEEGERVLTLSWEDVAPQGSPSP
jgi:hypothetical protein